MSNILQRIKSKMAEEKAPETSQRVGDGESELLDQDTLQPTPITHPNTEPVVIKKNLEATPMVGFTLETLSDELGKVLARAMHSACVSSIEAEALGVFYLAGVTPKGFTLVKDEYVGKDFYVLNNSDRSSEIFKLLVKALNSTSSERISFPYLVDTTLELNLRFIDDVKGYETTSITAKSLCFTPKEIKELNYAFIKEVQFWGKDDSVENSIDLLSFNVDREEWKAAPYRV